MSAGRLYDKITDKEMIKFEKTYGIAIVKEM